MLSISSACAWATLSARSPELETAILVMPVAGSAAIWLGVNIAMLDAESDTVTVMLVPFGPLIWRPGSSSAKACATLIWTEPFVETMLDTPSVGSPAMVVVDRSLMLALGAFSMTLRPVGAVTVMSAASRDIASFADKATLVSLDSSSRTPRADRLLI